MRLKFLLLLLTVCSATLGAQPDILYYKFDETSGNLARNNAVPGQGWTNGALSAAPVWNTATPQIPPAAVNNTGQGRRMSTGYSMNERNGQAFTIEFWFRTTGGGYQDFCNDSNTFGIWLSNGTIQVYMNGQVRLNSAAGQNDGQWRYCALTRDAGNNFTLYWGTTAGGLSTDTDTFNMTFSTSAFEMLYWQAQVPATYDGEMDEFRLWGVERTSAQLQANRFTGFATQDLDVFDPSMQFIKHQGDSNFTNVAAGTFTDYTFTVQNVRTSGNINFTPVSLSGITGCNASVIAQPTGPLTPGSTTTFTIRVTPLQAEFSFLVDVNNDRAPDPYQFTFNGMMNTGRPEMLYYRFNETTGNQARNDASPGRGTNPSTFADPPVWITAGHPLGASAAGSTADLPTGFSCTDLPRPEFTVEFWVRRSGNGTNTICGDNAAFRIYRQTQNLRIQAGPAGGDQDIDTGIDLANNTWTHLAFVSDPGVAGLRIYVNGTQQYQNINYTFPFVDAPFHVFSNGGTSTFGGQIDEFRFWAQARTQAQIAANTNNELVGRLEVRRPAATPIADGGTDNLGAITTGVTQNLTYTLANTGSTGLLMGNPAVSFSGNSNCAVSVTTNPSGILIPASNTTTATVQVTPSSPGPFSVQLQFASNDPDVPSYLVNVSGTASGSAQIQLERPALNVIPHLGNDTVTGAVAGATSNLTYTVRNPGTLPLNITGQSFSGASNCGVVVGTPSTNPVPAGSTATLPVSVTPTASGAFGFTLTVNSNAISTPVYSISVSGNAAVGGEIDVQRPAGIANSIADGGTDTVTGAIAGATTVLTYTIQNLGTATLTLTTPNPVSGNTPVNLAFASIIQPGSNVLAPSATTTFQVGLTPAAAGAFSLQLVVNSNDVNEGVYNINISGTASPGGEIHVERPVSTSIADGGTDPLGGGHVAGISLVLNYTVRNLGTAALTISGANLSNFTNCGANVTGALPGSIANGNSAVLQVTVTPTNGGPFSFDIDILSNDVDEGTYDILASGAAVPGGEIHLTRTGALADGATDALGGGYYVGAGIVLNYTVFNQGTSTLNLGGVTFSNISNCTPIVTTALPGSIAVSGSAPLQITVTPNGSGPFSFEFDIASDDQDENPYDITVSGDAVNAPQITFASPVNHGSSNVGVSAAPIAQNIGNSGGAPLTITSVTFIGANAADWALLSPAAPPPNIVIPGSGSTPFNVRFTPTATGSRNAQLRIVSDTGGVPGTVTLIDLQGTGTLAAIGVTTPVSYGSSNVGVATAPQNHQIDNGGSGPMRITAITLSGANPGDFALGGLPTFPHTVANGGNVVVNATFTPTATGARTATIDIAWDQGGGVGATVTSITLNGSGTQAVIGVATPVNYGSSNIGVTTAAINHQIDNSGSGPMRITGITLGGANPGDFALGGLPALPHTVASLGNVVLNATFTPTALNGRTATIDIAWDQGGGVGATVTSITLDGNGTQAAIGVTTPVNYGSSNLGVTTAPINHQIDNSGSGPMRITGISLSGAHPGDFALGGLPAFPHTVASLSNVVIDATFTPTALNGRTATIDIAWDQGGGVGPTVTSITLNGNGTQAVIGVTTPVNYGSANVGVTSAPINHQINNTGSGTLEITSIAVGGANPGDFALGGLPAFPHMVAGLGNLVINATFTPVATGARTANIDITWNQGGGIGATVTSITLNGIGTQAVIGVTTPVNYGSSNVGVTAAPQNHQIDNNGSGPMRITGIALTGTHAGDWALAGLPAFPHTIANGGDLTISGLFTPTAPGARTADIEISWDQGAGVAAAVTSITLNGSGTQAVIGVTTPVNYGSSNIGVTTAPQNHQIDNTGDGPMRITGITLGGANPGDFALGGVPGFPHTIAGPGNLIISASFTPTALNGRTATIDIAWDQGAGVGATVTSITLNGTGTQAAISVSSPINYGSSNVGVTTAPVNHSIGNTGSGPMRITAIALSGAHAADWNLLGLPAFPHTMPGPGNLLIGGEFTPSAIGARSAFIDITWDQGAGIGSTVTSIQLDGTGLQGQIGVASPVSYGNSNVGVTTSPVNHQIDNNGGGDMHITGISLSGAHAADWVLGGLPVFPHIVSGGGNLVITGQFTPSATGARTAFIDIAWDQGSGVGATVTSIQIDGNGTLGAINLTTPVDYGDSNVGVTTAPVNHAIDNNGTGPMRITGIALAGTHAGDWALSGLPTFPHTLASTGSLNISGEFTPGATGARTAFIQITWDQGGGIGSTSSTITLNGNGTLGVISVTTPVMYGASNVGVATAPINHQIDNIGSGPIEITGISLGGANPGDFALSGLPTFPHTAAALGNVLINAAFTPTAPGARVATIDIAWSQGGGVGATVTSITLDGNGTLGAISVNTPVNYGNSNVGVSTAPQNHQIDNTGDGPMRITGITLGGANPGDFALGGIPAFPHTVTALGNVVLNATFTPTAVGARTATIDIAWDQGAGVGATVTSITLNGNGTQGVMSVTTPINYGSGNVGVTGAPVNHQIDNVGTGPLRITNIALTGAHAGDWVLGGLPSFPHTVASLGNVIINATFTPSATGARTATIEITWDQGGVGSTTSSIMLNGNGTQAVIGVTTPVNYGSSNVGVQTAPVNHQIDNTGSGPMEITGISLGGANPGDWVLNALPVFPHSVTSLGNLLINGQFTPGATGARSATIDIAWNQGGGVNPTITSITVTGNGTQGQLGISSPVNYGDSNVGVATAPIPHQLNNNGAGPIEITAIALAGANPGDWALSGLPAFPHVIPGLGSLTVFADFTPTATGARNATIDIAWNQGGGGSPTVSNIALQGNGTLAVIGVTSPANYGDSNVGVTTPPQNHPVNNTGDGPMEITAITLTGANAGDWSLSGVPGFPHTVGSLGSLMLSADFTPSATGVRSAGIDITWNQGGGVGATVTSITLQGNGTLGSLTGVSPVAYGSVPMGQSSAPVNHDLDNLGDGPVRVTGITLSGANAGDWALGGLPGFPHVISSLSDLIITAQFTPTALGARTATIEVAWDQGSGVSPTTTFITLNGTGIVGGEIDVQRPAGAANSIADGGTDTVVGAVAGVNTMLTYTVENLGTGDLTLPAFAVSANTPVNLNFAGITQPSAGVLTQGNTTTFNINLQPANAGVFSLQLVVTSDDVDEGSYNINITGIAGSGGEIDVQRPAATSISNGGTDNVGTIPNGSPTVLTYTIENSGTGSLDLTGESFLNNVNCSVAIGAPSQDPVPNPGTATLNVTVTPNAGGGAWSFILRIESDDADEDPYDISVTGSAPSPTSVTNIIVAPDNGGPVLVSADVNGPIASLIDVAVTYTGGLNGPASCVLLDGAGQPISGNVIPAVPANTTITFYWDAYSTEGHHAANDYVLTLSPSISATPGVPGSSAPFALDRAGEWSRPFLSEEFKSPVSEHTMVYDPGNNRLVVFGGYRGPSLSNDTWEFDFDTASWRKLNPAGTPPSPRREVLSVFDPVNQRMIVFGGQVAGGVSNEAFALSLVPGSETWSPIATSSPAFPTARTHGSLVYDAANQRAVLFGGYRSPSVFGDTWALDLTLGAETWGSGPLAVTGTPGATVSHCSIYDPVGQRMLMLRPSGQLWELTLGGTPTWTELFPTNPPAARGYMTGIYDPVRHAMVIQGGLTGSMAFVDCWSLDIATLGWTQLPDDPGSGGRFWHTAAYLPGPDRMVIVGGRNAARQQTDSTALLDLAASSWLTPPDAPSDLAGPPGRRGAVMGYDAVNDRTLMWGGTGGETYADLWELDRTPGAQWMRLSPGGSTPSARAYVAQAVDTATNRLVIFGGDGAGGTFNDVWALDMTANPPNWQLLHDGTGTAPSARFGAAMAYDSSANQMVLFGGRGAANLADLWMFDLGGNTWSQPGSINGTPPSARYSHGAAYDSTGDRFVVFCGRATGELADVHAFDMGTSTWSDISGPGIGPRAQFAWSADATGDHVYVFGGKSTFYQLGDLYELDLTGAQAAWNVLSPGNSLPAEREDPACCLDAAGVLVMGTGGYLKKSLRDVWEYDTAAPSPEWLELALPDTPPNLSLAQVAHDPVGNRVIAFSGEIHFGPTSGLWQLDLSTQPPSWSRLTATGIAPRPRVNASMVYDDSGATPRMLMYGGRLSGANATTVAELWALELPPAGTPNWVQLANNPGNPGPRSDQAAIMDGGGNMVIFGGRNHYGWKLNDVRVLNPVTLAWTAPATSGTPPVQREGARAVLDYAPLAAPARNRMIVFGGVANTGYQGNTFALDLATWTWTQIGGTQPPAAAYHSFVLDPSQGRALMFGGRGPAALGGYYQFDFASSTWTLITGTHPSPQARWGHASVWDPGANRLVVIGGYTGATDQEAPLAELRGAAVDVWYWGN